VQTASVIVIQVGQDDVCDLLRLYSARYESFARGKAQIDQMPELEERVISDQQVRFERFTCAKAGVEKNDTLTDLKDDAMARHCACGRMRYWPHESECSVFD
jgi:hypothetical protein